LIACRPTLPSASPISNESRCEHHTIAPTTYTRNRSDCGLSTVSKNLLEIISGAW
jgi:hypothetical protein